MATTSGGTPNQQPSTPLNPQKNIFVGVPTILPAVILAVVLMGLAQFGSTEKLAAAFAWLIFVAVLMADGAGAFDNATNFINVLNPSAAGLNNPGTPYQPPTTGSKPA